MNTSSVSSKSNTSDTLPHLEALYAMAQVLTLDAEKAAQLLERTYNRALDLTGQKATAFEDRRYMMQLLIRLHHEQPAVETISDEAEKHAPPRQESFKQRIFEQFLQESAPVAFAALNDSERALLTLCEVENMSSADAALILGASHESTSAQLEEVRDRFKEIIRTNASPVEAELLQQFGATDWIGSALRKAMNSKFASSPPTLEPRLKSKLVARYPVEINEDRRSVQAVRRREAEDAPIADKRFSRGFTTLLLILAAGMVGYIGSSVLSRQPESDLVTLSVQKAPRAETILQTSDIETAEQFVQKQMDWRLSLPTIIQGTLTGVGISEIAQNVRVPVFLYKDEQSPSQETITVYVFTYALLDQFADRIALERDILNAISTEDHFDIRELSELGKVVIWRNDNDIFMAVTNSDARELRQRIEQH